MNSYRSLRDMWSFITRSGQATPLGMTHRRSERRKRHRISAAVYDASAVTCFFVQIRHLSICFFVQTSPFNRERLYFYSRSDSSHRENHMDIDFLITEEGKVCPVEVKSGNYRSHSSLDKFRTRFASVIGNSYILYTKDLMIKNGIIHLPLYMAELL